MDKIRTNIIIYINLLLIFSPYGIAIASNDSKSWQCTAYDAEQKEWLEQSDYQITALNKSFAECKKQSRFPHTCTINKANCKALVFGIPLKINSDWSCIALDEAGISWPSNIYNSAMEAAMAAKEYCRENSAVPDTCYIYNYTCKNFTAKK